MDKSMTGNNKQAKEWIESSNLAEEKKLSLMNFVSAFPTLNFFREDRPDSDPEWLREQGMALLGVDTMALVWVKFKKFAYTDDFSEPEEMEVWYGWQYLGEDFGEYNRFYIDDEPVYMVAAVMEDFSSLLAIKAGVSGDMGVYEFNGDQEDDDRIENLGNKEGRVKCSRLAFHSYAEMLEQIAEIKIGDEIFVSEKNKTEAKGHKVYSIDKEDCIECGSCAEECQNGSITQEDGYYSINPDTCTNCGDCADICPVEIIKKR